MRTTVISLLLLILSAAKAQVVEPNLKWGKPTEHELSMTDYAPAPDADAVMLCHQTDVRYDVIGQDLKVIYRIKGRLKVLKPEGKSVADMSILYRETSNRQREVVVGLKATAYNLTDGQLVKTKMEKSMMNEERIDKERKLLKFSVPQVRVGTVIEYEYNIESDYIYSIHDWYAQRSIPVLYTDYYLSIPEWFVFSINQTGAHQLTGENASESMSLVLNGSAVPTTARIWTFKGHSLPAMKGDDYLWCANDYADKVTAELSSIYVPGSVAKNFTSSWSDIDKLLMDDDDFGGRQKNSSPLKDDIARAGIAEIADVSERIAALWQLLRSKVRWNGNYALWGQSASSVLKEGTGSNADLNFLFINMLHDAGIEASPVVLRTRDEGSLPLTHASLKYLNTFIVGIEPPGSPVIYFDSSAEDGYLNVLPPRLLVDRARFIKKDAADEWVNLQETANGREVSIIKATLGSDGMLRGERERMLTDESASALRRMWRQAKDSTELIHSLQESYELQIESYQLQGNRDFSPTVKEQLSFTKQCDAADGIIYLNPLIFTMMKEAPFTADTRSLPVEFPFKQSNNITVLIDLPEGYTVEDVPQPTLLKLDGAMARFSCNASEEQIIMQYRFNIDRVFFAPSDYQTLKQFFDQLAENCKTIITIKKKP